MTSFDDYFNKCMENPEFRKEYEALEPEFESVRRILEAKSEGMSRNVLTDGSEECACNDHDDLEDKDLTFRIEYNGYTATVRHDPEFGYYIGKADNITPPVTFWARDIGNIKSEFAQSINIWLQLCEKHRGK